eukprot:TRINITY_DN3316_c0_g1_i1.p1 TRINITY_DN3316_c0_g1~~TRINITY_DN3316_c0_g1_i1.p1  ORF type:complete len:262 (+),score=56.77 TRINITY_DN3316_c0_g1_i1:194-979(+)
MCIRDRGLMLHTKKVPGTVIPMVRAKCTFSTIPVHVVAKALTLEHRAKWDKGAQSLPLGTYRDGTLATCTIYQGALTIDDRDFIDVSRIRTTEGVVETVYIDGSGFISEDLINQAKQAHNRKKRKTVRGSSMLSCQRLTSTSNGGTNVVTISHVDLKLGKTARGIAQKQMPSRTRDWFKAMREACLTIMEEEQQANSIGTADGASAEDGCRSSSLVPVPDNRSMPDTSSRAIVPRPSGSGRRESFSPHEERCEMCKACSIC